MTKKLGIIQSRGLGDIIIALPIADYYREEGWQIYWPVCQPWIEQLEAWAPWIKWIPLTPDHGAFFYDTPLQRLQNLGCEEVLSLYQALTGHPEFSREPYFQHTSFDQYKYLRAGVPFERKWRLSQCITRQTQREQALYDRIYNLDPRPYVLTHLRSSEQTVRIPDTLIPQEYRVIPVTDEGWLGDWLLLCERAEALVMTDSSLANLVDQLGIPTEKYFIPQHHIGLTPVHLGNWQWLANPDLKRSATIFGV